MARRRRLTPAQPGYVAPVEPAPQTPPAGLPGTARVAPIAQVSGQSAEAAALREMATGLQSARDEGRMIVDVPLTDVSPVFLMRDRIVLDREELEALKASISRHGQRVPAEITPLASPPDSGPEAGGSVYRFGLIAGWRRLTALNELYTETRDPKFSTLRALIRPAGETADSYVAMVEENEIRVGLSYYERARLVAELTRQGVFADQSAALRTLFGAASRAKRSKIGSFVDLVEGLGDVLAFPTAIPERLGLALVSRLRMGGAAVRQEMRAALSEAGVASAEAELAVLERLTRAPKVADVSRAKQAAEVLRPGVTLKTSQKGGKLTLTLSGAGVDQGLIERLRAALRQE